jgi:hypothetical protein
MCVRFSKALGWVAGADPGADRTTAATTRSRSRQASRPETTSSARRSSHCTLRRALVAPSTRFSNNSVRVQANGR